MTSVMSPTILTGNEYINKEFRATSSSSDDVESADSEDSERSIYFDSVESLSDTQDESVGDKSRPRTPRRASSLMSGGKSPLGRKKSVRFADVLGMDLEYVKTFLSEVPTVPRSAFSDLSLRDTMEIITTPRFSQPAPKTTLLPGFHQPVCMPNFYDRIREEKVLLENCYLTENQIKGTVRVLNLGFHKSVYIRYTFNDWNTINESIATYCANCYDGFSDRFEFSIKVNLAELQIGSRVSFCLRYHCLGQQFWDNNSNGNYIFYVVVPSTSAPPARW